MIRPAGYLYRSRTTHVRYQPFRRRFAYGLFQVFLDVDRIEEACRAAPLLRHNRPGLLSFYASDHGDRTGAPLGPWARRALSAAGAEIGDGPVWLLTFPRLLGYVFNPLSVYFGYDPSGALRGVLYEVTNTFGETHTYAAELEAGIPPHAVQKRLHVSPFFDVAGMHRFKLQAPGERLSLLIENEVAGERQHLATLIGRRRPLSNRSLLAALLGEPFLTVKVLAAIHWEALWIWSRGAKYRAKPRPPTEPVSFGALALQALPQTNKND